MLLAYPFFAMRAVYGQSILKTLLKYLLLMFGYLLVFGICLVVTLIITILLA